MTYTCNLARQWDHFKSEGTIILLFDNNKLSSNNKILRVGNCMLAEDMVKRIEQEEVQEWLAPPFS